VPERELHDRVSHRTAALLALAVGLAGGCGGRPPAYNVLLISLDTVRRDALGCYGASPVHAPGISPTPVLDDLARQGVRMLEAYAPSSWTLPSHLSLMTGEPPLVHGVETEVGTLDPSSPTLAEILRQHGYRTFGIYSAPYLEPHWGFGRGFDRYDAAYAPDVVTASERAAAVRTAVEAAAAAGDWKRYESLKREQVERDRELGKAAEVAVTSDQITAAVVREIEATASDPRPWFLFAHFFDPHCDYVPPPPYDTRFDPDYTGSATGEGCLTGAWVGGPDPDHPGGFIRVISDRDLEHVEALYEGEVAWVDAHVGTILRALDAAGLARTTLVIVVSDHGEEFFEHGKLGHRQTLYEEVVRIPMLLRLPAALPAGTSVPGVVALTDVLPTVLDVLGLPAPETPGARSFLPLIRGREAPEERTALFRLVMMYAGDVESDLDAGNPVTLRQVTVQDAFRRGPLKITRARSWPQFPADAPPALAAVFAQEAAAQYGREQLRWIDVARFPDERDGAHSTAFADPAPRAALGAFRAEYEALVGLRRHRTSPLPESVRRNLESLGYVDRGPGPAFPEPDVVLPPPGAR